ncbi:MAG TPA: response regulator [Rhizomicrobium sp.]|jgi:DNA-binding NtrC family response regulator|nr:response regulator [Rhizomicrobium sp.]
MNFWSAGPLECDFKVLDAPNADAAIEAIQQTGMNVDILISDVRMPGSMDGFGFAAWLKEHLPQVPVILTSGHAQAADVAKELCDHVGEIVKKPYDFDALAARIEKSLSAKKGSS